LCVDTMRPANNRCVFKFMSAICEGMNESRNPFKEQYSGLSALNGKRGIDHIARCHAEMDKARIRPDGLGNIRQEGNNIVLRLALDLIDPLRIESSFLADFLGYSIGNNAQLFLLLNSEKFYFK